MTNKRKTILYYLLSFLLPFLIVATVFIYLRITPFGDQNFLLSDIGAQYIPFLTNLRHIFLSGNFSLYSFNLSLGDNMFPLISYYLLSPFNFLLLLFPANAVPTALSWIIILKISTIGFTSSLFIKKSYKNNDFINLAFSTVFALCGFVATYFYDLMWLDALILLPLVVLGIQSLFYKGKTTLYVSTLLLTIITNYYLGYMTCLFSLFYFIYLLILNKSFNKKPIILFSISSLLSAAMSTVILLPTALGMLETAKQSVKVKNFLPTPSFGISGLSQFGAVGSDYTQRISHNPSVFMGSVAFILLISFFINKNITKQKKIAASFLLVTLFLGLFIRTFNTVWHMFQHPAGFPFRNVFFFTFIAIMLAYESWQAHPTKKNLLISGATASGLLAVGYFFANISHNLVDPKYLIYDIGFLILSLLGLLLINRSRKYTYLILIILSFELGFNFIGGLAGAKFGDQKPYLKNYTIEQRWFNRINDSSDSFFRVDNNKSLINHAYDLKYNNYNDSLLFNVKTTDLYSSTLNNNTRKMLKHLGYYSKNVRRVNSFGNTPITNNLFDIKYKLSMSTHDYDLTKNKVLGVGFAANKRILKTKFVKDDPILNQTTVWNDITNQNKEYFKQTSAIESDKKLYVVSQKKTSINVNDKKISVPAHTITSLGKNSNLNLNSRPSSEKFYYFNNTDFAKSTKQITKFTMSKKWNAQNISGTIHINKTNQTLLMSIPYDKGWDAVVNGRQVNIKRVSGNLISIPVTQGSNNVQLKYNVPGLSKGVQISILSLVIYLLMLLIQYFRKKDQL
ncbi:YfhO family protein [Companilactobacillus keshanensis]|uniref:YfhO family protein n=1 Tax=Companilactobacillus keshanensis TaxID=2486003 RepID=A0ABW4BXU6_9LACO|nr:YfhO family protein [Companilactobacillus keshanensis]